MAASAPSLDSKAPASLSAGAAAAAAAAKSKESERKKQHHDDELLASSPAFYAGIIDDVGLNQQLVLKRFTDPQQKAALQQVKVVIEDWRAMYDTQKKNQHAMDAIKNHAGYPMGDKGVFTIAQGMLLFALCDSTDPGKSGQLRDGKISGISCFAAFNGRAFYQALKCRFVGVALEKYSPLAEDGNASRVKNVQTQGHTTILNNSLERIEAGQLLYFCAPNYMTLALDSKDGSSGSKVVIPFSRPHNETAVNGAFYGMIKVVRPFDENAAFVRLALKFANFESYLTTKGVTGVDYTQVQKGFNTLREDVASALFDGTEKKSKNTKTPEAKTSLSGRALTTLCALKLVIDLVSSKVPGADFHLQLLSAYVRLTSSRNWFSRLFVQTPKKSGVELKGWESNDYKTLVPAGNVPTWTAEQTQKATALTNLLHQRCVSVLVSDLKQGTGYAHARATSEANKGEVLQVELLS